MTKELFKDSSRSMRDFAGVFEREELTSYFYLYEIGKGIAGAQNVTHQAHLAPRNDIKIEWNSDETRVVLKLRNEVIAVFDVSLPLVQ